MKVKVVIPARYHSSRLPKKPLLLIGGYPIFWHVVQRVKEAGIPEEDIILATDHSEIELVAQKFNISVVMTSSNHESGTDRLNEVSKSLGWSEDTLILNVQGDEPLIPYQLIKQLTKFAQKNTRYPICTAVIPLRNLTSLNNPNVVKAVITSNGKALYFSRAPVPFDRDNVDDLCGLYRHIGIYSYTVRSLSNFCSFPSSFLEQKEKLEQLRALENDIAIGAIAFSGDVPHGIDTQDDYETVKKLMENK